MNSTINSTGLRRGPVSATAVKSRRRRPFFLDLYSTAVGKKYVMAITGLAMIGFVVFHMIGNLKMYLGQADLDHYAEFLKELLYPIAPKGVVLWILRGGLLTMLALHLHSAWSLTRLNRTARAVKYQGPRDYQVANFASRTMRWTGIIVLAYLIWHLLDLTFGTVNAVGADGEFVRGEVYNNVVRSLDRPIVAAFYIVANILLGIHLFHGAWSFFQSLGWNNPRFNAWRRGFAVGIATVVVVGNVSFPVAVLAGIVK
ncbi:MAG: succinate dehydrogenase [Actinobacteria bacterium]|jgi:succinate dehydrogenase / fumarate reductase cytochrome b subunit|nr:succinate dehydrogenase [Actinomycetota bacterium]NCZ91470.1 succinate dehydrogenase [Actinomycetota bacterium]NCZ92843.1 succinate dehydrogenase [Actinomycetota bacterium]NDC45546.1 succinate dehydrogenase [Actinomycetota bacterium]NDD86452.1 succinate dehydrogenase [Actinomycetota bacterium]